MRKEINLKNARLVMTRDELGFSEIINDFKTAKYIYILTYNISKFDDFLLDKLQNTSDSTEIKIFTNIPNRFESYFAKSHANQAEKLINIYLEKLDPVKFNNQLSTYFAFGNHSKIIMTNNIAYIGSANYSKESANNFETGVIVEDSHTINEIKDLINEVVKPHSEDYYEFETLPLLLLIRTVEEFSTYLKEEIWGVWEFLGLHTGEYYKGINIHLNNDFIEAFSQLQEDLHESLSNYANNIEENDVNLNYTILLELINNLSKYINDYTIDQEVEEFLDYDESKAINEQMNEHAIEMNEDVLNDYIERFTNSAHEIKSELADNAQNGFLDIESYLSNVTNLISDILNELKKYPNQKIDNTK
ncbi:phospholipase D-like domain-containing protein [Alkalihalobacillus sp. FSL R5-0424]